MRLPATRAGRSNASGLFLKARQEGKIRHLGFSAHNAEAELSLMDRYQFASVLFPVNYLNYAQGNFDPQILAKAKEKGIARSALKSMAYTTWKKDETHTYPKCWYYPIEDPELAWARRPESRLLLIWTEMETSEQK